VVAIGRSVVVEGWAGLSAVEVRADARHGGLARSVMAALLREAGQRGSRDVYLQVAAANATARALYERLGFTTHHAYRYRGVPPPDAAS
jgi:N-acetylglutamate synthase